MTVESQNEANEQEQDTSQVDENNVDETQDDAIDLEGENETGQESEETANEQVDDNSETEQDDSVITLVEKDEETTTESALKLNTEKWKSLGIEANSEDDLIEKVASIKGQALEFANEEIKEFFEAANEVARNGQNFQEVFDTGREKARLDAAIKAEESNSVEQEKLLEQMRDLALSSPENVVQLSLENEIRNAFPNISQDQLRKRIDDQMEGMDTVQIQQAATNAVSLFSTHVSSLKINAASKIGDYRAKITDLDNSVKQKVDEARKANQAFIEKIHTQIDEFESPVNLTHSMKMKGQIKSLVSSPPKTVSLPSAMYDLLFTKEGELDLGKVEMLMFGKDVINHIKTNTTSATRREELNKGAMVSENDNSLSGKDLPKKTKGNKGIGRMLGDSMNN